MCGVAIQQVSQKKAIGSPGMVPIKTFDPRAAWPEGKNNRPNSPHFHRSSQFKSYAPIPEQINKKSFLLPKALFATRKRSPSGFVPSHELSAQASLWRVLRRERKWPRAARQVCVWQKRKGDQRLHPSRWSAPGARRRGEPSL